MNLVIKKKLKNGKQMRKLLLTIIMVDLEWVTSKGKLVIYIEAFVKLYK